MTTVQCVLCAIVPRAGVRHRLFFLSSDTTVRERLASGPITTNQSAKNFFSSAFVSAGRCSMSQCPVSVNRMEVTFVATIFA
jgi:hypothetical protein